MTRRGFSLLEVLIAIALTAALVGSMFAFLWDTLETRERMTMHAARRRSATTVIDRLERDLATIVASDPESGVGVDGTETSLRLLVRSVPARLADGASPELALVDLELVEYRFDAGRRQLAIRRSTAGAGESSSAIPLDGTVRHARWRYYDGSSWNASFNSRDGGLPVAVELAIWYDWSPDPEEDTIAEVDEPEGRSRGGGFLGFEDIRTEFDLGTRDDLASADDGALGDEPPPLPDRVRVIVVPDARAEQEESGP